MGMQPCADPSLLPSFFYKSAKVEPHTKLPFLA